MVKNCATHELLAEITLSASEEEVEQFVPSSANESSEAGTEELCNDSQDMSIIRLLKHITNHDSNIKCMLWFQLY